LNDSEVVLSSDFSAKVWQEGLPSNAFQMKRKK